MIRAIALDDERPALDVIEAFCSRIPSITLVKSFTRTGEARLYLESNPVDLIFLDINMPRESGLEFSRSINQQSMVIFTTAYSEFAAESYEVEAVDYLLKPFTFERFGLAVQKAQVRLKSLSTERMEGGEPAHLFLRVDYGLVKVTLSDILFIEGLDNYLKIHLRGTGTRALVVRLTMKAMQDKLPPEHFVRVHRSYIVPLDKIRTVRNKVILIGDEEIPIGSSYEKDFLDRFIK